jgi:IrrE N-terminal-like domain
MATLNDRALDSMVEYLFRRASSVASIAAPIDLFNLAKLQRITTVDLRPMIPAGGLSCNTSGFIVYIQDLDLSEPMRAPTSGPSEDRPKLSSRQRFTFAHELAHTLLFGSSDPPQVRDDAPKGSKLEALCHRAARRILMPERLVTAEVNARQRLGSFEVQDLAKLFDVSLEVALWRCDELPTVRDSERALLYIRKSAAGSDQIAGFLCSNWFQDRMGRPNLRMSPAKWLSSFVDQRFWEDPRARSLINETDSEIKITRVPFRRYAHFVELERLRT